MSITPGYGKGLLYSEKKTWLFVLIRADTFSFRFLIIQQGVTVELKYTNRASKNSDLTAGLPPIDLHII
jgi:hypothetical protein